MKKINWENLKERKCPKCGYYLTKGTMYECGMCGFLMSVGKVFNSVGKEPRNLLKEADELLKSARKKFKK